MGCGPRRARSLGFLREMLNRHVTNYCGSSKNVWKPAVEESGSSPRSSRSRPPPLRRRPAHQPWSASRRDQAASRPLLDHGDHGYLRPSGLLPDPRTCRCPRRSLTPKSTDKRRTMPDPEETSGKDGNEKVNYPLTISGWVPWDSNPQPTG